MDKVIIITGASSGIGLATAHYLSGNGCKVYGIARNAFKDEKFECLQGDVNNTDRIKEIFAEIFAKEGRIDAVINNAGFGIAGAIEDTKPENVEAIINTNLSAVIKICTIAIGYLKQSKSGRIINISSVGGIAPLGYQACYSASKAGVEIFSRALNEEVNPYNIKVTAVLPGDLNTGFTAARVVDENKDNVNKRMRESVQKMEKSERGGKSPIVVSKVIYKLLKAKRPPLRKSVGFMAKFEVFLMRIFPTRIVNFVVGKLY